MTFEQCLHRVKMHQSAIMSRRFTSFGVAQLLIVSLLVITVQIQQTHCNDIAVWNTITNKIEWSDPIKLINNTELIMQMDETKVLTFTVFNLPKSLLEQHKASIQFISHNEILSIARSIPLDEIDNENKWTGNVTAHAEFIGRANITIHVEYDSGSQSSEALQMIIVREERFIDKLFLISVISLMSILYINFGAALDLQNVKSALVRPIGPGIAFFCHFIVLPLVNLAKFYCLKSAVNELFPPRK